MIFRWINSSTVTTRRATCCTSSTTWPTRWPTRRTARSRPIWTNSTAITTSASSPACSAVRLPQARSPPVAVDGVHQPQADLGPRRHGQLEQLYERAQHDRRHRVQCHRGAGGEQGKPDRFLQQRRDHQWHRHAGLRQRRQHDDHARPERPRQHDCGDGREVRRLGPAGRSGQLDADPIAMYQYDGEGR